MTDVSARKGMDDALRASEERFRLAFENGPVGMAFIGLEGSLLRANRCLCDMLGYTEEELLGKSLGEIAHPDDLGADADLARQMIAGELPGYTVDKRYLRKDGQVVWARLTAAPLRDRHAKILCVVGIVEDITERKQVEEALRRTERLAAIGTLAAGLAHEINNPLGAIVLSTDVAMLALDGSGKREVMATSLGNIQKAALRCGRIVKSILQFARDEVSNKWPCDVADVARHARDLTRKLAAEAGVAVRLEIRDEMPPLVMNPTEMEQVLVNLIVNAIQASSRGSEVLVRLESWQDFVRIVVQDWGRGMSASEVSHVFDPFFTTRHADGGLGLGLSITYGIVQQHGATIEVRSQPGQGTIAEIIFPVAEGPSQGTGQYGQDPNR
jgi:PAS domain S-box-containing protein